MAEIKTFPIRLSARSDALLRDKFRYKGDLSSQLATILETVNLSEIELLAFPTGRPAKDDDETVRPVLRTSIRMDISLYEKVRRAATKRSVSINEMLNSAIQAAHATL